jgi:hypothetical protein
VAQVLLIPHNPGPANDSEQRVLEILAKELPDFMYLIPNVTIPCALPQSLKE